MRPILFEMTKILGLDISSVSTGYCILNNGRLLKSTLGVIAPPNKKSILGEKLLYFEKELEHIIEEYKPDYIAIEDIFRGPNIITFKTLAMFRGVCFKVVFKMLNVNPICIMPTEARNLVGTNGVKKEDAFKFVMNKYSLPNYKFNTHSDITDSIVLALACYEAQKSGIKLGVKKRKRKKKKRKK